MKIVNALKFYPRVFGPNENELILAQRTLGSHNFFSHDRNDG